MSKFKVGDMVQCIDNYCLHDQAHYDMITVGGVYEVVGEWGSMLNVTVYANTPHQRVVGFYVERFIPTTPLPDELFKL